MKTFGSVELRQWLFESALPIWWLNGHDPKGGFHEKLDLSGAAVPAPRRARMVARQVFSYCEAGKLGWPGPWHEAARHALKYLNERFLLPDGTVLATLAHDGAVLDSSFNLYNQAFALLAFASAHECLGHSSDSKAKAIRLRETLQTFYAHPKGGFYEDIERKLGPLRSNPHMHLLESALAWAAIDSDPAWMAMADEIVELCLSRFIESSSGALREFFDLEWRPAGGTEGQIVEPGHQYEWSYLLELWAKVKRTSTPGAVAGLLQFADAHGIDGSRGVAINELLSDGAVRDASARLWPQTERIRAYTIHSQGCGQLPQAIKGLTGYLQTETPGLWFDRQLEDGRYVYEPSPATSLYHIVGAVKALEMGTFRAYAAAEDCWTASTRTRCPS